jgi:hypothetical protein
MECLEEVNQLAIYWYEIGKVRNRDANLSFNPSNQPSMDLLMMLVDFHHSLCLHQKEKDTRKCFFFGEVSLSLSFDVSYFSSLQLSA